MSQSSSVRSAVCSWNIDCSVLVFAPLDGDRRQEADDLLPRRALCAALAAPLAPPLARSARQGGGPAQIQEVLRRERHTLTQ
eukprot:6042649-Pyramimonas_sp.AAC.1